MLSHIFRSQCYKRQAAAANLAGRSAQVAEGRRGDQQRFQAAGVGRNVRKKKIKYIYIYKYLVGGLEHFFHILGILIPTD